MSDDAQKKSDSDKKSGSHKKSDSHSDAEMLGDNMRALLSSSPLPKVNITEKRRGLTPLPARLSMAPLAIRAQPASTSTENQRVIEAMRAFVTLIDAGRPGLRGHSTFVARLVQDTCERLKMAPADTEALVMAGYVHDLGKAQGGRAPNAASAATIAAPHLTSLNVATFRAFADIARDLWTMPIQIMDAVGLPAIGRTALESMYERPDGRGVPHGLAGNDVPLGARILAVADTFADLTRNRRNTFDKLMSTEEAMGALEKRADQVFDREIVRIFHLAATGERIVSELGEERHRVLLLDRDFAQMLVLQLRLTDQGYDVHLARGRAEARELLSAHRFAFVMSELDLDTPGSGLELCEEIRAKGGSSCPEWMFLAQASVPDAARRAFAAGGVDFFVKPANPEVVIAKLERLASEARERPSNSATSAPRGVTGSLEDMCLTELVQVVSQGRRTASIVCEWASGKHGEVQFAQGEIVHALTADAEGTTAFYRLMSYGDDGTFRIDPTFTPSGEPTIKGSTDYLLLEAMRLIDEQLVP